MLYPNLGLAGFLLLFLASFACGELLLRIGFADFLKEGAFLFVRINKVFKSKRVSDHWKEIAILGYAQRVLKFGIYAPCMLSLSFFPVLLVLWIFSPSFELFVSYSFAPLILFAVSVCAGGYILFRRFF